MYSRRLMIVLAVFYSLFFTLAAHAQLPQISSGLSYLTSSQNPDGTWGNTASVQETTATTVAGIETMKLLNQTAGSAYTNATGWLQGQTPHGVDYIAQRIRALSITDNSITAILPFADPASGAWGGDEGHATNALDTASVLQALRSANSPDLSVANFALAYLTNTQNTDGGWGFSAGDDSSIYVTSIVSATLRQYPQTTKIATALARSSAWLISQQNADGGFGVTAAGTTASSAFETALAYIALIGDGQTGAQQAAPLRALTYLTSTQSLNGSWNDDPYSTALAIRALYYSENPMSPPPGALTTAGVMGSVVDGATGLPLAGVGASVAGNSALSATSNANGVFVLNNIGSGRQQVTLSMTGYASQTIMLTLANGDFINAGRISLLATAPTTGTVMGTVWDTDLNTPFSGVTVRVVSGGTTYDTISGADGSFRLANIPAGSVTLSTPEGPKNKPAYWSITTISTLPAGGILVYNPRMVQAQHTPAYAVPYVRSDKQLYHNGDTVNLTADIQNNRSTGYAATLRLRVFNPNNASVYDTITNITLTANTLLTQNASFSLPASAMGGTYTVQAEVNDASNTLLGSAISAFTLQVIPITVTPKLPAQFGQGNNSIAFELANNRSIPVSSGNLTLTMKDPDGQVAATASQTFTLNANETKTINLILLLPNLKFGTYTLAYTQSDEATSGVTGEISLPNSVNLTAAFDKYSYKASDTANLQISLNNTGKFNLAATTLTVALPDAGYSDSKTLTIGTGQQTQQNVIPLGTLATGEHATAITLTLPGGATTSKNIPCLVAQSILSITPADGSRDVPVRTSILVHLSESVNPASITADMVSLSANGTQIPGTISLTSDGSSLVFTPQDKLAYAATYTFTIKAAAQATTGKSTVIDLASSFSTPTFDPDLVGYWPMDEDWKDYSGKGNNADAYGSSTFSDGRNLGVSAATFVNDSKSFPGSGGYVPATKEYIADAPNTFTISFWAKPDAERTSTTETISGIKGIGGQRYAIAPTNVSTFSIAGAGAGVSVGTNGISVFEHTGSYLPSVLVYDVPPDSLSGWNHIVVVYCRAPW